MKGIKKEDKERVMDYVDKSNSGEYETRWEREGPKQVKKIEVKKGRKSKAQGTLFELKVRKDLEKKDWIVDKWSNNIDPNEGKLTIAKKIFNPFKKIAVPASGFPDFIAIKHLSEGMYQVKGVEVKMNGLLSKEEKEKCAWYLQKKIFSEIWIASKGDKRGEVKYDDFNEKYGNKYNKA